MAYQNQAKNAAGQSARCSVKKIALFHIRVFQLQKQTPCTTKRVVHNKIKNIFNLLIINYLNKKHQSVSHFFIQVIPLRNGTPQTH